MSIPDTSVAGASPLYTHACPRCVYLGPLDVDARRADLYVCRSSDSSPADVSFLARFSSETGDYVCGEALAYGVSAALTEARRRAQRLGLCAYRLAAGARYLGANVPDALFELRRESEGAPLTGFIEAALASDRERARYLLDDLAGTLRQQWDAWGPSAGLSAKPQPTDADLRAWVLSDASVLVLRLWPQAALQFAAYCATLDA